MTDARPLLRQRVALLDQAPSVADRPERSDPDLTHAVHIMESVVAPGVVADRSVLPRAAAADADHLVDKCRLLQRLAERIPEVVVGPLSRETQVWVGTGPSTHRPPRSATLDQGHFVEAGAAPLTPSAKPFHLGLYTSTRAGDSFGMWWAYLDINRGSTLFTLPWTTWSVAMSPDGRVFEVGSASDWARLIAGYPLLHDGFIYPDWRHVAVEWDAVHVTLRAVVATQGICLEVGDGLAAAPYWDVESTLWLRWVVDDMRLLYIEQG